MTTTTTDAQKIATRFGNDGLNWHDSDGVHIDDALGAAGGVLEHRRHGCWRHQMPDGSAIVVTGEAWNLGITGRPECICLSDDGATCCEPDNCSCECHADENPL